MTRVLDTGQQTYDLLRQAQEAAYRLPADSGGFAATLRCSAGGRWMPASVRAQAPSAMEVDLTDGAGGDRPGAVGRRGAESGRLARSDSCSDAYVETGGVLLPQRRQVVSAVDGGTERREVRLCGHVLPGAAAP